MSFGVLRDKYVKQVSLKTHNKLRLLETFVLSYTTLY